jgi:nucleoid-associated protein YgaU
MNKKILFILTLLACALTVAGAQSLMDNQYQKAGADFERQAAAAMETGDYDQAAILADKATEQYRLSREYASNQQLVYRAANAISLARSAIANVETSPELAKKYAVELTQAKVLLKEAEALYSASNWEASRIKAEEALARAKTIPVPTAATVITATVPTPSGTVALPRYYVVGTWEKNRDCFWNIAKNPAIYGNPHLWQKLYEANKSKLRNPENPNLIHPGIKLEVPPLKGEKREGNYTPGTKYEALPK